MPSSEQSIRIVPGSVDLKSHGVRHYRVCLDAPNFTIELPLSVVRNGEGPKVLLAGGTHGDEFEGQIAVCELAREICETAVTGLLILLPLHNLPACLAGTRTGPNDGADLNRLFVAEPTVEGPSGAIARFVRDIVLPAVDWVVDIHSGGTAHEFVLSSNLQATPGTEEYDQMLPALLAFGAPYALVFNEAGVSDMPHRGTLEGLARELGKRAISTELGGGGRATAVSLRVARRGIRRLLSYIGVLADIGPTSADRSKLLTLTRPEQYVAAAASGRLAPSCELGDSVRFGDVLGELLPLADPLGPPSPVRANCDGIVVAIASRGVQAAGSTLFYVAEPVTDCAVGPPSVPVLPVI